MTPEEQERLSSEIGELKDDTSAAAVFLDEVAADMRVAQATIEALSTMIDRIEGNSGDARSTNQAVNDRLLSLETWVGNQPTEPDPDPPVDPPVDPGVKHWRPPTGFGTEVLWHFEECADQIRARIGGDVEVDWNDGAYVSKSQGLQFHPDGGMSFHLDPAKRLDNPNTGGANWVVSAMPLAHPGTDVEMRYRLTLPADLGASMKFPGFQTNTGDQLAPGGGHTGAGQFIARPCASDWNKDSAGLIGPYAYWPVRADEGSERINPPRPPSIRLWHPPRPDYSLWWYADSEARIVPNQVVEISLRVQRTDTGWLVSQQTNGRLITYTYDRHANEPEIVSHMAFLVMYGGNSAFYGPSAPTVTKIENLEVITRA